MTDTIKVPLTRDQIRICMDSIYESYSDVTTNEIEWQKSSDLYNLFQTYLEE